MPSRFGLGVLIGILAVEISSPNESAVLLNFWSILNLDSKENIDKSPTFFGGLYQASHEIVVVDPTVPGP